MTAAALMVLVAVAAVSLWALRLRPGRLALEDFARIWVPAVVCVALMPVFGAMAAAGYWLLAVAT